MYIELYGLTKSPFSATADPNFFFESVFHKEALAALSYGIHGRKGIILITGEVGTGKTTLVKSFLNQISQNVRTSLILNPYFSDVQLLEAIVEDFGIKPVKKGRLAIIKELNSFLLDVSMDGGNAVLIIDEAQNLTARQLEQVRLLSNLETSDYKLLQIVLIGQPELKENLDKHNMRQISQRIFVKYNISPLKEEEISRYVEFRLNKAGAYGVTILPESYKIIYAFSGGTPRLINMLCDRALLLGFVGEKKALGKELFQACLDELK